MQTRKTEQAEAERIRVQALRPDHIKLLEVAEEVLRIKVPEVSVGAHDAARAIAELLVTAAGEVTQVANTLLLTREAT